MFTIIVLAGWLLRKRRKVFFLLLPPWHHQCHTNTHTYINTTFRTIGFPPWSMQAVRQACRPVGCVCLCHGQISIPPWPLLMSTIDRSIDGRSDPSAWREFDNRTPCIPFTGISYLPWVSTIVLTGFAKPKIWRLKAVQLACPFRVGEDYNVSDGPQR